MCLALLLVLALPGHLVILRLISTQPMEALSQLDVTNPDHVSVITRDGKLTVSVMKDGASVTLGFPIRDIFNTKPPIALQQTTEPKLIKTTVKQEDAADKPIKANKLLKDAINHSNGNRKLTTADVKEIKEILTNKALMKQMGTRKNAYSDLAQAYGVSFYCIKAIDNGATWSWLKV